MRVPPCARAATSACDGVARRARPTLPMRLARRFLQTASVARAREHRARLRPGLGRADNDVYELTFINDITDHALALRWHVMFVSGEGVRRRLMVVCLSPLSRHGRMVMGRRQLSGVADSGRLRSITIGRALFPVAYAATQPPHPSPRAAAEDAEPRSTSVRAPNTVGTLRPRRRPSWARGR